MGDADKHLRPLPGSPPGQVNCAVFGDHIVALTARVGDDLPVEIGNDAGRSDTFFIYMSRGHADEGLAAARHSRPGEIIQLPAGPADMAQAGTLSVDLSVEIYGNTVVDGDHFVLSGDRLCRVHIFQRLDDHPWIAVHPVIKGL